SCFPTAPPPTEISTLSLHDALPISRRARARRARLGRLEFRVQRHHDLVPRDLEQGRRDRARLWLGPCVLRVDAAVRARDPARRRSEEHTSELQSRFDLVCRLLLEKK